MECLACKEDSYLLDGDCVAEADCGTGYRANDVTNTCDRKLILCF